MWCAVKFLDDDKCVWPVAAECIRKFKLPLNSYQVYKIPNPVEIKSIDGSQTSGTGRVRKGTVLFVKDSLNELVEELQDRRVRRPPPRLLMDCTTTGSESEPEQGTSYSESQSQSLLSINHKKIPQVTELRRQLQMSLLEKKKKQLDLPTPHKSASNIKKNKPGINTEVMSFGDSSLACSGIDNADDIIDLNNNSESENEGAAECLSQSPLISTDWDEMLKQSYEEICSPLEKTQEELMSPSSSEDHSSVKSKEAEPHEINTDSSSTDMEADHNRGRESRERQCVKSVRGSDLSSDEEEVTTASQQKHQVTKKTEKVLSKINKAQEKQELIMEKLSGGCDDYKLLVQRSDKVVEAKLALLQSMEDPSFQNFKSCIEFLLHEREELKQLVHNACRERNSLRNEANLLRNLNVQYQTGAVKKFQDFLDGAQLGDVHPLKGPALKDIPIEERPVGAQFDGKVHLGYGKTISTSDYNDILAEGESPGRFVRKLLEKAMGNEVVMSGSKTGRGKDNLQYDSTSYLACEATYLNWLDKHPSVSEAVKCVEKTQFDAHVRSAKSDLLKLVKNTGKDKGNKNENKTSKEKEGKEKEKVSASTKNEKDGSKDRPHKTQKKEEPNSGKDNKGNIKKKAGEGQSKEDYKNLKGKEVKTKEKVSGAVNVTKNDNRSKDGRKTGVEKEERAKQKGGANKEESQREGTKQ